MKKTLNSEIIFYISDLHPALSFSYKLVFKSAYSGSEYLEEIFFYTFGCLDVCIQSTRLVNTTKKWKSTTKN